jgi:hypothetical protein
MHMHYPEVDIPLNVIEVAIFESRDISQSDKPMPGFHNHLKGNTLTILGSSQPVACLPCGEVGHQLRASSAFEIYIMRTNVSPESEIVPVVYPPNSDQTPLNATPVVAFPTEIQQMVSRRYGKTTSLKLNARESEQ